MTEKEGAEWLFSQLAELQTFSTHPLFCHWVYARPPVFRDGTLVPSFLYSMKLCTASTKYRGLGVYSLNKTGGRRKLFLTSANVTS
jgi:hypothetical protein